MGLEAQLYEALLETYRRAGKEVGYWAHRFRQALERTGGVHTAKRMMRPRNLAQRAGLDRMLEAGRPDLTLEWVILRPRFRRLFSASELETAAQRLKDYRKIVASHKLRKDRLYPDELVPGLKYVEGAPRHVIVNAYERDPRARKACVKHWGFHCAVCALLFENRYGIIGKGFIHIHHLHPMARGKGKRQVDPIKDLRPVCPNCHAMLHRPGDRVLSIIELTSRLRH